MSSILFAIDLEQAGPTKIMSLMCLTHYEVLGKYRNQHENLIVTIVQSPGYKIFSWLNLRSQILCFGVRLHT